MALKIKSGRSNVGHISIGFFFTITEIKGRTEKRGNGGTLKDPIPVSTFCLAHRRKIIPGQFILKKPHRSRKIHIDLKTGNFAGRDQRFGIFLKLLNFLCVFKHTKWGIHRLVKQSLKKILVGDPVVGINDLLYKIFNDRCCFCRNILFLPDRIGYDHIIKLAIEETCHHDDRNSYCDHQDQSEF